MTLHTLDATRLLCPLPLTRLQQLISRIPAGDSVKIVCRDPGVKQDIPAWCRIHGHLCLNIQEAESEIELLIQKKGSN